jgi:hypothetical protein
MSALSIQGRRSNETLLFNRSECSTIRFKSYSINTIRNIKRHDIGRLFRPVKFSVLFPILFLLPCPKARKELTWTTALLHGL